MKTSRKSFVVLSLSKVNTLLPETEGSRELSDSKSDEKTNFQIIIWRDARVKTPQEQHYLNVPHI